MERVHLVRWAEVHARLLERSGDAQGLTPSQSVAAVTIEKALKQGVPYLNLWGPAGVGKTFLAHHLVQRCQGIYLPAPAAQTTTALSGRWVCVDNVRATRAEVRTVYSKLSWREATAVLVVTQTPAQDSVYAVQLQLTMNDLATVRKTMLALYRDCSLPDVGANSTTLWMFVSACVRRELGANSHSG